MLSYLNAAQCAKDIHLSTKDKHLSTKDKHLFSP